MITVVPAILPDDLEDLTTKVGMVAKFAPRVQIDIVDGKFAKNTTWPFSRDSASFRKIASEEQGLPFWETVSYEIDMMVRTPELIFEDWISAGASALIIHRTSVTDEVLATILARSVLRGVEVGIAITPTASLESISSWIPSISFVQVMGSETIGLQGTPLVEEAYSTIATLRAEFPTLPIAVDIGVNRATAPKLVASGATKLVSGSMIFESQNPKETIQWLESL